MRRLLVATLLAGAIPLLPASTQTRPDTSKQKTDDLPLKAARTIEFATSEGTWISLDVSPDGRTIVFELLGDLYALPIAGGAARRLTSGPAFDSQPRYSPDGKHIETLNEIWPQQRALPRMWWWEQEPKGVK